MLFLKPIDIHAVHVDACWLKPFFLTITGDVFRALNVVNKTLPTFKLSIFEEPKKTTFFGECFEPEFILDFQQCNNVKNQTIQGFDPIVFDSSTDIPQLLKSHVLGIPERLQCCITLPSVLETERFVLGQCLNLVQPERMKIFIIDITSSVMCESYQQYPPWDLTTMTEFELRINHCVCDRLSFNEVTVFVIRWLCFHSKDGYILHASNAVNNVTTLLHYKRSGWIILLQTQLMNVVVGVSCSKRDNNIFFFSYLQSGQTYLTHVNRNITILFGKNILECKGEHFTDAKKNSISDSPVLDISCTKFSRCFAVRYTTISHSRYIERKRMLSCPHFMPLRMLNQGK